ncbi:hypothetical protein FEMY_13070 [Ferrovum myxofaciens]|uniref:Uncharacterized protein n=1 Tax=Ferrovum myxofaciens TaxID=416213 RepID=A0A149VZ76_9PROT|nr:hypothetical protein FEMY_13070 [Ferrovum myxofaciens]
MCIRDRSIHFVGGRDQTEFVEGGVPRFSANENSDAFAVLACIEQLQQTGFLLEEVEETAQTAQVAGHVVAADETGFATQDIIIGTGLEDFFPKGQGPAGECANIGTQSVEFAMQRVHHSIEILATALFIKVLGGFGQLLGGVVLVCDQDAVLDISFQGNQNEEQAVFRETQEFYTLEARETPFWSAHDAGKGGEFGEHLGRGSHQLLRVGRAQLQLGQGRDFQGLDGQQAVHEETVTARSRNAPGRGMRAGDKTQLFQIGHDVANGGGGEVHARKARQGPGTDGLTLVDVLFHQSFEQSPRAIV